MSKSVSVDGKKLTVQTHVAFGKTHPVVFVPFSAAPGQTEALDLGRELLSRNGDYVQSGAGETAPWTFVHLRLDSRVLGLSPGLFTKEYPVLGICYSEGTGRAWRLHLHVHDPARGADAWKMISRVRHSQDGMGNVRRELLPSIPYLYPRLYDFAQSRLLYTTEAICREGDAEVVWELLEAVEALGAARPEGTPWHNIVKGLTSGRVNMLRKPEDAPVEV